MSTKKLFAVLFTAVLLSLAFVSAGTLTQTINSTTYTSTLSGTITSIIIPTISNAASANIAPTPSINGQIITFSASPDYTLLNMGQSYSGTYIFNNGTLNDTTSLQFVKSYCSAGENLSANGLEIFSVGSNVDFDWQPLDSVELSIDMINKNQDVSKDVTVEVELYSVADNKIVKINGNDKKLSDNIRIAKDSDEKFTFSFIVSPSLSEGDYRLYVKAYVTGKESTQCIASSSDMGSNTFQLVSIDYGNKDTIVDLTTIPSSIPCGSSDQVSMDIYNLVLGDNEDMAVTLYSKELGLNINSDQFNLDEGKFQTVTFDISVPLNATAKSYPITVVTRYNYKKSSDTYGDSNTDSSFQLKVDGCVPPVTSSVTAQLNSETPKAVIGGQVIIDATVKNTGTSSAAYTVDVAGNSAWSSLAQIDPKTFTLGAGEEKKVSIYLNIDSNAAAGDQTFTIKTTSGTYSADKTVQLTLEKGLTSSAIIKNLKQYWYIYVIALIILILVIAIIVAIVSLAKKS